MARPGGIMKQDQEAHRLFGEQYGKIPKSVFACIAYHLANLCGESCDDPEAAMRRFYEEWRALHMNGIVPQEPNKAARAALSTEAE